MENIVEIKGNVQYTITLDPSVWIFDDRKLELHTFFEQSHRENDELELYTKSISEHWDREIIEGAQLPSQVPPTSKSEKRFKKERLLNSTFGIYLQPFLENAKPNPVAKIFVIETKDNEYPFSIDQSGEIILCFSDKGRPLKEDGPIHVYLKDGSNKNNPIKNIKAFRIE